jgi:hypothetical protein
MTTYSAETNLVSKKRKSHFSLKSRTQIYLNRKSIEEKINQVQIFCHQIGLEITSLKIMKYDNSEDNEEPRKPEIIYIDRQFETESRKDLISKALHAKDLSSLSDRGYNIFLQNFKAEFSLPTIRELLDLKKDLKTLYRMESITKGVFNNPLDKIIFVCDLFIKLNGFFKNDEIILKLTGDSMQTTRTGVKLFNVAFSIIDEREKPMSADGNYILGFYNLLLI